MRRFIDRLLWPVSVLWNEGLSSARLLFTKLEDLEPFDWDDELLDRYEYKEGAYVEQ